MLLAQHGIQRHECRYLDTRQPRRVYAIVQGSGFRNTSYLTVPFDSTVAGAPSRVLIAYLCPDVARSAARSAAHHRDHRGSSGGRGSSVDHRDHRGSSGGRGSSVDRGISENRSGDEDRSGGEDRGDGEDQVTSLGHELCDLSYVAATCVHLPLAVVLNSWCDLDARVEVHSIFYTAREIRCPPLTRAGGGDGLGDAL
jgi:hypothetical protein